MGVLPRRTHSAEEPESVSSRAPNSVESFPDRASQINSEHVISLRNAIADPVAQVNTSARSAMSCSAELRLGPKSSTSFSISAHSAISELYPAADSGRACTVRQDDAGLSF